jgi:hypothetical protein
MTMFMYDSVDSLKRSARRWRRRAVRRGEFLPAAAFCARRGISSTQLRCLERRGMVFGVRIAQGQYYPAMLTGLPGVQLSRLDRLCRRLMPMPGWFKYDALVSIRGSLGGVAVLQLLRRGDGYRRARRYAVATVADNQGD